MTRSERVDNNETINSEMMFKGRSEVKSMYFINLENRWVLGR